MMHARGSGRRRSGRGVSLRGATARLLRAMFEEHLGKAWPNPQWQGDPVGFARTILGVELWEAQVRILESIRDNRKTAVAGGRKIGKDFALGVASWWWYSSFPDAVVFMTATTAKQIDEILYVEVRRMYARGGKCVECKRGDPSGAFPAPCAHSVLLAGDVGQLARTGVRSPDMRRIFGYTSEKEEGLAGLSGPRVLALIDEASGYPEELHTAIVGNLAAEGCREVQIGNPTRSRGFFFDSFHRDAEGCARVQVSSETTPNILEGRDVFPGLASRVWLEERRQEWGEGSPLYRIHVKGEFVLNEEGAIFPVDAIDAATQRWSETAGEGSLSVGIDPAGEKDTGDESAFAVRRGRKVLEVLARRGLAADGHLVELLGLAAKHRERGDEPARVVVDREGEAGNRVYGVLLAYLQKTESEKTPAPFLLVGVRASERAKRRPEQYDRVRDELAAALADWVRDGGAIPEDLKLARELNVLRWVPHISGRQKLIDKDTLRKELGRSPDRYDAVALSTWGATTLGSTAIAETRSQNEPSPNPYDAPPEQTFDPYSALNAFK